MDDDKNNIFRLVPKSDTVGFTNVNEELSGRGIFSGEKEFQEFFSSITSTHNYSDVTGIVSMVMVDDGYNGESSPHFYLLTSPNDALSTVGGLEFIKTKIIESKESYSTKLVTPDE